jgi:hypothetical protein
MTLDLCCNKNEWSLNGLLLNCDSDDPDSREAEYASICKGIYEYAGIPMQNNICISCNFALQNMIIYKKKRMICIIICKRICRNIIKHAR